jgi:LmbE family N-acetylglucosaminyl deacetylase
MCKNLRIRTPWLIISPHFDDAVLSCGHLLAKNPGAVVATICGGIAAPGVPASTWWDRRSWKSARDATLGRRQEDFEALECLNAVQAFADVLDVTYRGHDDDASVFATAIGDILDRFDAEHIAIPLAARAHIDHELTRDGALTALRTRGLANVFFYADLPYFVGRDTDRIARALSAIPVPQAPAHDSENELKREAVTKYRSQTPLLRRSFRRSYNSIFSPDAERLYRYQPT